MNPNGTISEILNYKGTNAWFISPEATVFEAVQMMSDKNVGALLVTEGDKLVGIISERDYTRKVVLKGKASKQTAVREILSGHVIHVSPGKHGGRVHAADDRPSDSAPAGSGGRPNRGHRIDWRPGQLDYHRPDDEDPASCRPTLTGIRHDAVTCRASASRPLTRSALGGWRTSSLPRPPRASGIGS